MTKKFIIQKEDLYQYYIVENHTILETIEHFNASGNIIINRLREYNIKKPKELERKNAIKSLKENNTVPYDLLTYDNLYDMYCIKNLSAKDIARELNTSRSSVTRALSENNIKKPVGLIFQNRSNGQKKADFNARKLKAKKTKFEKYGDENYCNVEKMKDTKLKKYGKLSVGHKNGFTYNDITFDSKPELALYIYAMDNGEQIEREPFALSYFVNGQEHLYFPDFLYNGTLVEIKGDYLVNSEGLVINIYRPDDDIDLAKNVCMQQNNVKILTSKDYNKYLDYCSNRGIDLEQYRNKSKPKRAEFGSEEHHNKISKSLKGKMPLKAINAAAKANSKKVKCIELNLDFDSMKAAADYFRCSTTAISSAVKRNGTCCGYHFIKL